MHNRIKLHAFFFGKNNERKGKSMIVQLIENIYQFLWGEWIHVPLPGGGSLGLSLLIILLLPAHVYSNNYRSFRKLRSFARSAATQPLIPPAVTPSTKYSCAKKYRRIGGTIEIRDMAIT